MTVSCLSVFWLMKRQKVDISVHFALVKGHKINMFITALLSQPTYVRSKVIGVGTQLSADGFVDKDARPALTQDLQLITQQEVHLVSSVIFSRLPVMIALLNIALQLHQFSLSSTKTTYEESNAVDCNCSLAPKSGGHQIWFQN